MNTTKGRGADEKECHIEYYLIATSLTKADLSRKSSGKYVYKTHRFQIIEEI